MNFETNSILKERTDLITTRSNQEGAVAEAIDMMLNDGNQRVVHE